MAQQRGQIDEGGDDGRDDDRPDLAAMMAPLLRELIDAELPVLDANGITMWAYSVLLTLDRGPMRSQAALAEAIGADKTRIIPTLDELQALGYIERQPDPDDRRVHLLAVTDAGRRVKASTQAAIQRGEEHWLARLSATDRAAFIRVLRQFADERRARSERRD